MNTQKRNLKERICALLLAVAMVFTLVLPDTALIVRAEETPAATPETTVDVAFQITDASNSNAVLTDNQVLKVWKTAESEAQAAEIAYDKTTSSYHASLEDGEEYEYSVEKSGYEYSDSSLTRKFKVNSADNQPVKISMKLSKVTLDQSGLQLTIGQKQTLNITNPVAGVTYNWESDRADIATVSANGEVEAKAEGTAHITAKYGDKTASDSIEVNVAKITLERLSLKVTPTEGTDVSSIECLVTGFPESGILATGTVQYTFNGITKSESVGKSVTFDAPSGDVTITAEYSGDNNYSAVKDLTSGPFNYKRTKALKIDPSSKDSLSVALSKAEAEYQIPLDTSTIGERALSYESSNPEVVSVDETKPGKFTVKAAGKATITVKAAENTQYAEAVLTYPVCVKKEIDLANTKLNWTGTKIYDGKPEVTLKAELNGDNAITVDGQEISDLTVTADATVASDDINVGTKKDATLKEQVLKVTGTVNGVADTDLSDCYDFSQKEDFKAEKSVNITARPVYVQVEKNTTQGYESSVVYGTSNEEKLAQIKKDCKTTLIGTDGSITGEISGLVSGEKADLLDLGNNTEIKLDEANTYYVGTYNSAIVPVVKDGKAVVGNYELRIASDGTQYGTLNVTAEDHLSNEELWNRIQFNAAEGTNTKLYQKGSEYWVNRNGVLEFNIKEGRTDYDTVTVGATGNILSVNSCSTEDAITDIGDKEVGLALSHSENADTKTNTGKIPSGVLKVDDIAPVVEYQIEVGTLSDPFQMKLFKNTEFELGFTAKDTGSGLKETSYYKMPIDSKATKTDIENQMKSLASDNTIAWEKCNGTVSIPKEEGNYIIVVKAVDNVGNTSLTGSNGIVVDVTNPTLTLTINSTSKNGYYNSDVNYTIEAEDPVSNLAVSDLASIQISVSSNEQEISGTGDFTDENIVNEETSVIRDSYALSEEDLQKVKKDGKYQFRGAISVSKTETKSIDITATATDKAGNSVSITKQTIQTDGVAPVIEAGYDQTAENENYQNRTLTVTYTERAFSEKEAKFTIKIDGTEHTYSLEDLKANKVSGVTVGNAQVTKGATADENQTSYAITFSGKDNDETDLDKDYEITEIKLTDEAGNEGTADLSGLQNSFTVDGTKPLIDVKYDNNDVKNGEYFNAERTATVTFTERNYDESKISFKLKLNETSYTLTDLVTANGIKSVSADNQDGDKHTYTIVFGKKENEKSYDHDFDFLPEIEDKAGNKNDGVKYADDTKAGQIFTIDMDAPVLSTEYNALEKGAFTPGIKQEDTVYKNANVKATYTIKERNFSASDVVITESAKNYDEDGNLNVDVDITGLKHEEQAKNNWKISTDHNNSLTLDFTEDGNYEFGIAYTDLAGNELVDSTGKPVSDNKVYFTVDKVDPTGNITISSDSKKKEYKSLVDKITNFIFDFFSNKETSVTMESSDVTSPLVSKYYIYVPATDKKDDAGNYTSMKIEDLKKIEAKDWTTDADEHAGNYSQTYTLEENSKAVPYLYLVDKAGNETYLTANGAIQEANEPTIEITAKNPDNTVADVDFFKGDANFTVSVADPSVDDTYSGLAKVECQILKDGEEIKKYEFKYDPEKLIQKMSEDLTIAASGNNSNDIVIKVTARDNAGNFREEEKKLAIDTTKPEIKVSYDNNDAANEKYFKADRTMTVVYTERNFDEDRATFDVTLDGKEFKNVKLKDLNDYDGITVVSGPTDSESEKPVNKYTDERTNTYTILFNGGEAKDKDYIVIPHITDAAGNSNVKEGLSYVDGTIASQEFTIDKVAPMIDVKYDNNDVKNGKYFNADRTATVTFTERNYDESKISFNLNGTSYTLTDLVTADGIQSVSRDNPDGVKHIYKIVFGEKENEKSYDHDFNFLPVIEDKAGNKNAKVKYADGTKAGQIFTVDKVAPTIDVAYTTAGSAVTTGTDENSRLYKNEDITATVTINERNFSKETGFSEDPKQMNLSYEAKNYKRDKDIKTENYTDSANTKDNWSSNTIERTTKFQFTEDANYTLGITYRDLAGNEVVYNTHYFTVDKTAPTGSINIKGTNGENKSWIEWVKDVFFNIFTNGSKTVSMTSEDETAGVATTQYYKYHPDAESRYTFQGLTLEQLNNMTEDDWTMGSSSCSTSVDANEQAIVYEKIVDKAGNVRYINNQEGVIADNTAPEAPQIKISIADPAQGIYNSNVPFTIDVKDPKKGETYAGLKEVYYEITNNGTVTQSGNYNSELADPTARKQKISHSETVMAALNNSNHVQIKVKAVDYAGNTSEATKDLKIDITNPEVTITFDLNNPLNGKYYKDTRTATISVKERNFDQNAVNLTITNTDGTMPSVSGWSISPQAGESDEAINTCTVTFSADGDYNMSMQCTDKAGNGSNTATIEEFTVDKTVPTISVSYDNNNAATAGYYNANRTATISITEHNFNAAEVNAKITAALQGSGVSVPGVGGWSTSGDVHTASVTFSEDADYTFDIDYTDLAGNAAADYTQDQFTVDKTAPEVEFFDITDKSANNGTVAPGVTYSDVNYTADQVEITISGAKHNTEALSGERSSIANGESIKMADFAHTEDVDDVYTMKAVITDKAGNKTEKQVMFSVNRFGSNYIFSSSTEKFLNDVYANEAEDIVVTEINVDTLVFNGISYSLDNKTTELTRGVDYLVSEKGGDGSWKEYTYTINKKNFEKEGRYNVTIDSEDAATNTMNNKLKDSNINFVIDKTPPTVVITGIEENSYRADSRDMTVNLSDNTAVKKLDIQINGESVATYDQKEIEKAGGQITYAIESSNSKQNIKAVAVDLANNENASDEHRVLVTTNLLIQFVNNTPLFAGTICVVVAGAGAAVYVFGFKKRKSAKTK